MFLLLLSKKTFPVVHVLLFYVVSASHDSQLKNCGYELSADVCSCPVNERWSEQSKALRAREEL